MYELIDLKKQKLYGTFYKIKPQIRRHRRWNPIGKAWKHIAGSPDEDDLRLIDDTLNLLIKQNNKQSLINEALEERINNLTSATNRFIKFERDHHKTGLSFISLTAIISNMDSLQRQLEEFEEAIMLANKELPSSKLFTIHDVKTIMESLNNHDTRYSSFEEVMTRSSAQVMVNNTHMIYILKIPQTSRKEYEYSFIDPIVKDMKRVFTKQNYVLSRDGETFELDQPCNRHNSQYICDSSSLNPATDCINNLLHGRTSSCTMEKVYSKGIIKRISEAILLVNNAVAEIYSSCSNMTQIINGSFLIHFEKCNILVNGETYDNHELVLNGRPYTPTTGVVVIEKDIIDSPPEYIEDLNLPKRDHLQAVQFNYSSKWIFGSSGAASILIITAVIKIIAIIKRKRKTKVKVKVIDSRGPLMPPSLMQPSSEDRRT